MFELQHRDGTDEVDVDDMTDGQQVGYLTDFHPCGALNAATPPTLGTVLCGATKHHGDPRQAGTPTDKFARGPVKLTESMQRA